MDALDSDFLSAYDQQYDADSNDDDWMSNYDYDYEYIDFFKDNVDNDSEDSLTLAEPLGITAAANAVSGAATPPQVFYMEQPIFSLTSIVKLCGIFTNTLLLIGLIIGLIIYRRRGDIMRFKWSKFWILLLASLTHILYLTNSLLEHSVYKAYNRWMTSHSTACLVMKSLPSIFDTVAIVYVLMLAIHGFLHVHAPHAIAGPKQFVFWIVTSIAVWPTVVGVTLYVQAPITNVYNSLMDSHCLIDLGTEKFYMTTYIYAILFGMMMTLVLFSLLGLSADAVNTNAPRAFSLDTLVCIQTIKWIMKLRSMATMFVTMTMALTFMSRVPIYIAMVYELDYPLDADTVFTHRSWQVYHGHFALFPVCCMLLRDVRELLWSVLTCCHTKNNRASEAETAV